MVLPRAYDTTIDPSGEIKASLGNNPLAEDAPDDQRPAELQGPPNSVINDVPPAPPNSIVPPPPEGAQADAAAAKSDEPASALGEPAPSDGQAERRAEDLKKSA